MSIINGLFGGSGSNVGGETSFGVDAAVATAPQAGLSLQDVLSTDSSDSSSSLIGSLDAGLAAPTAVGVSAESHNDALLGLL